MKINDNRTLRTTGILVLILAALVFFYYEWSGTAANSGEVSTDTRGARVRISSEKGTRPARAPRSERGKVSSNQKALILPLSRTPNPTTEQCLEVLASSPLEADRVRAAMLLGQRAKEKGLAAKAVPALISALDNDEAPQVWLVCAQALGKYGSGAAEAVPTLLKWFDHATMRDVSIDALADIGSSAEPAIALISPVALDSQERFISRRKAIEAIVRIGGSGHAGVAEVLTSAAEDADPQIRLVAQQPLKSYHTRIATPGVSPKQAQ